MRLIITGGAGFIGSNLILYWMKNYPEDVILNVDKLTYASDPDNLREIEGNRNYQFIRADLADMNAVKEAVEGFEPDGVLHLAAESHVDNSINNPADFIYSNVVGTFHLLESCRQYLLKSGRNFDSFRFHHVSTDEVYGTLKDTGYFTEDTPYAPNSPYSATKASSDHLVRSYYRTFGLNTVITNCSNNFGPHQHSEKLIPTIILNALKNKPIPVYGNGENVREWLFVMEHCRAIDIVFHKGRIGESYNIGSHNERRNIDLVMEICDILNELVGQSPEGDYKKRITFVKDRPGHDFRYALSTEKMEKEFQWKSSRDFHSDLKETILWYLGRNI